MGRVRIKFKIKTKSFDAVIFDMDGVVTQTAKLHAAAWKDLFDEYLRDIGGRKGIDYGSFSMEDYRLYVDGKPRYEGVKSFLESRGIDFVEWGDLDDPPGHETICSIGNKKNQLFHDKIREAGVEVYQSSIELIRKLRSRNVLTGIVTSSKNCNDVLRAAGIETMFDTKVDGLDSERLSLAGKPQPDIFLHAAQNLGAPPGRSVVFEDAIAGVQAGKRGHFGCVIGVDRNHQEKALRESGADITVKDLSEIDVE